LSIDRRPGIGDSRFGGRFGYDSPPFGYRDRIRYCLYADGDFVTIFVRRTVVWDSSERYTLAIAEWSPFAGIFQHTPVALAALEKGIGRPVTALPRAA
jgi:hypothetical protein